jgi:dipeptidyl aminopeptidase/acylaminoacyl peptidase
MVIVPGRGVPRTACDWLAEGAVAAGWSSSVVDGLYSGAIDDRGGPAAYAAVAELVAEAMPARHGRLVTAGHSTGARVALHLATRFDLSGVAALCGIANFADHVNRARNYLPDYVAAVTADLGDPVDQPAPYRERSPVTWIDRIRCPLLLVAAAEDRVCPPYQTQLLVTACLAANVRIEAATIPGAGHFFETQAATGTARPAVLSLLTAWLRGLASTGKSGSATSA